MREPSQPMPPGIWATVVKACGIVLALSIILALARFLPATTQLTQMMASWQHAKLAPAYFIALGLPYAALGMPRQALCITAGVVFGVIMGLVLVIGVTLGGNLIDYYLALVVTRYHRVRCRKTTRYSTWRNRFSALRQAAQRAPFRTILILRLLPVGSALLVALGAGTCELPLIPFTMATLLGSLPQNLVFVLIGSGTHIGRGTQIIFGLLLFVVSMVLGLLLMRFERKTARILQDKDPYKL